MATLAVSGVLLAGTACTTEAGPPSVSSAGTSSQKPESKPTISVFEDLQFMHKLGEVASYDIVCVYRKDKANPSIQPKNVQAYYVSATEPPRLLTGFVDPAHAGMVTGMSPECNTPSLPPEVPASSQPPPSVQA